MAEWMINVVMSSHQMSWLNRFRAAAQYLSRSIKSTCAFRRHSIQCFLSSSPFSVTSWLLFNNVLRVLSQLSKRICFLSVVMCGFQWYLPPLIFFYNVNPQHDGAAVRTVATEQKYSISWPSGGLTWLKVWVQMLVLFFWVLKWNHLTCPGCSLAIPSAPANLKMNDQMDINPNISISISHALSATTIPAS